LITRNEKTKDVFNLVVGITKDIIMEMENINSNPKNNQIMKNIFLLILFNFLITTFINSQDIIINNKQKQEIQSLIDKYSQAREKKDTLLLESILAIDIDQLVSSGEWRYGKNESMKGMLQSSVGNPGLRKIIIENIRFLNPECGIVDARYEIQNTDGTARKMWSTFIVVYNEDMWKITAIRNMLPA
jgi:hypothetical protein